MLIACLSVSCGKAEIQNRKEIKQLVQEQMILQSCFMEKMPVSISGYIRQNNNNSSIDIYIRNNSEYVISAVKLVLQCYDVYGKEMWDTPFGISYKTYCIDSGKTQNVAYFIPHYTKFAKIYVYSVYYEKNYQKEWGTRDITLDEIYAYAPVIDVEYTR